MNRICIPFETSWDSFLSSFFASRPLCTTPPIFFFYIPHILEHTLTPFAAYLFERKRRCTYVLYVLNIVCRISKVTEYKDPPGNFLVEMSTYRYDSGGRGRETKVLERRKLLRGKRALMTKGVRVKKNACLRFYYGGHSCGRGGTRGEIISSPTVQLAFYTRSTELERGNGGKNVIRDCIS